GAPEIVAFASADDHNAGNANATAIGGRHFIAYYSGNSKITEVLVSEISAPAGEKEKAKPPKK
ncbi:MAG: hypothetical protein IJI37_01600, partial [Opitutales bacterium]|nr:hypothetical protein [Opitutales bacterium]